MLKHILTGQQPSTAGSRHHNDYQTQIHHQQTPPIVANQTSGGVPPHHHHHHHHHNNNSGNGNPAGHAHSDHHHHHHQQQQQQHQQQHQHFTGPAPSSVTNRIPGGRNNQSSDVYDPLALHPNQRNAIGASVQSHQPTPSSTHRHPLNHSQLSVNNLSQRLNHSHVLNLSALSTSKHSVNSASPIVGNNNNNISMNNNNNNGMHQMITHIPHGPPHERERIQANGGLDISRVSRLPSQATPSPAPVPVHAPVPQVVQTAPTSSGGNTGPLVHLNTSWSSTLSKNNNSNNSGNGNNRATVPIQQQQEAGVKEMLTFLGLLCLVSLLLAMLSHIFLLKISPLTVTPSSLISPEEYTIVYEVTLALCALALSLNLCCLLVCAIQFLFAVKLVKSSYQSHRTNKYLQKSSISRVCAVGGFFVSIPVFLTGMILYTFIQFHSTPAIVMSVFIGLGIVFCGCAMVHNVFVWQREKTNAVKALTRARCEAAAQLQRQQQSQQQQGRGGSAIATLHRGGCNNGGPKIGNSTATLQQNSRGCSSANYQQPYHHHHHHHHHQQQQQQNNNQQQNRHVQMSPPLLISSPSSGSAGAHGHHGASSGGGHGNNRIVATPPTTPGDRSPPSPGNIKHNNGRSQSHLQRDASGSVSPGLPTATLDLSSAATTNSPHELSTLV